MLRGRERSWSAVTLAAGGTRALEGVSGDSCELRVEIGAAASGYAGVKVRASSDGAEETLLYYDAETRELVFDSTRSGSAGRKAVERAPFALGKDEALELRIFVDRSVVEIFANDRQAIGRRVYPVRSDSLGVVLFSRGGPAEIRRVTAWDLMPSNPY